MSTPDFKSTFPILKFEGEEALSTVADEEEMKWQVANRNAQIVGSFTHLNWQECQKRYPRVCKAIEDCGYSPQEAANIFSHFRYMRRLKRTSLDEALVLRAIRSISKPSTRTVL